MRDQPSDLIQSVSRAMRILEEVGASLAPLTVKAIARRCDLNLSTTYHLVRTLSYEGYLVRDREGHYVLGSSVARRFHDLQASFDQPPEVHDVQVPVAYEGDVTAVGETRVLPESLETTWEKLRTEFGAQAQ